MEFLSHRIAKRFTRRYRLPVAAKSATIGRMLRWEPQAVDAFLSRQRRAGTAPVQSA